MKLNQKSFNDTVLGAEKEMNFSISDDNPIIFEILRDKMYANKIGSICREVSSNSRDANREAGNGDLPIEIQIVDPKDEFNLGQLVGHQSISFKDYGIGITPDRMENVFVKYAASTKRDSNGQTGGFGLGAKTPFAYTDTFTIITVCDWEGRMQRFTYTAMIDSSRKGKMILFEAEDVDPKENVTGTQIVIPINTPMDRDRFETECRNYTSYWGEGTVKYINFNDDIKEKTTIFEDEDIVVFYSKDEHHRYRMLIDGIPYPLDLNQVDGIKENDGIGQDFCIALKFDVGDLTISANRESVQYDEDTVKKIAEKYGEVQDKVYEFILENTVKFDTYLSACIALNTVMASTRNFDKNEIESDLGMVMANRAFANGYWSSDRGLLSERRGDFIKTLSSDGREPKKDFKFGHHKIFKVRQPSSYEKTNYAEMDAFMFTTKNIETEVFYGDKKKNARRNATIFQNCQEFFLIVPKGTDEEAQKEEMLEWITIGLDFQMYGDVEMAKNSSAGSTSTGAYKPGETVNIKCRKYINSSYSNYNESFVLEVDRKSEEIVGDLEWEDVIIHVMPSVRTLDSDLNGKMSDRIKLIMDSYDDGEEPTILFINERFYTRYFEDKGLPTIDEAYQKIEDKLMAQWKKNAFIQRIHDAFDDYRVSYKMKNVLQLFPEMAPKCVIEMQEKWPEIKGTDYIALVGGSRNVPFNAEGLRNKINALDDKYPLLAPYIYDKGIERAKKNIAHLRKYISGVA